MITEKQNFRFEFIGPIPDSMKIHHDSIIYYGEIRDAQKIKNLLSQIHSENRLFLTKKTYLDNDYFNFLKEYLESIFQKGRISSQIIKRE